MASIVVTGDTSGAITIAAPAVAGTNTLTLPASTGTLVVTGGAQTIEFADGSASAPSITNSGDTNTGMFFPAADTIAFTEGGTESMRIDSSGRVGIGTTSPTQQLDVTATSSATSIIVAQNTTATSGGAQLRAGNPQNLFIIGTDSNAGGLTGTANSSFLYTSSTSPIVFLPNATERMRIDSSGNVGIGASPSFQLDVVRASASTPQVRVQNTTTTSQTVSLTAANDAGTSVGMGVFGSAAGTAGMIGAGAPIIGTAATELNIYANNGSGVIKFATGGLTERMRIDSSGNLLVGTTNSSGQAGIGFKVIPSATYPQLSMVGSATTNAATTLEMYSTGAAAYRFYVGYGGTVFATNTTISAISDQRLKENIVDLDDGLDSLMALKPRKFDWKEGKGKDIKGDRGFIAQEFETVFPDLVDEWKDPAPEGEEPYKSVRADLIPVLVKAIQEQQQIINDLKARIETLENT